MTIEKSAARNSVSLVGMTLEEIANGIAGGELRSQDVVRACLDRIADRDGAVRAFVSLDPERAMAEAKTRDAEKPRGPLHGIPVAIKDVLDTVDFPTGMGSPIYKANRPDCDASVVALLKAAGAIVIGKTHTAEFAGFVGPPTTNPWNRAHSPGGSSSGSAAAVADLMVPMAIGTQTGGSVIRPSAYCGVFGFKPTFGRVNRAGLKFVSEAMDTIGWMARSPGDLALLDSVLAPGDMTPRPKAAGGIRIGICRTPLWERALPETRIALEQGASVLTKAGFRVETCELPAFFNELPSARQAVNNYDRARAQAFEWNDHRSALSPQLSRVVERGFTIPHADYTAALRFLETARRDFDAFLDDWDCLLTPCADGEAPVGLEDTGESTFQSPWTLLHTPALNLPTSSGPKNLPVSIQLVGRRYADRALLQMAGQMWNAFGLGDRARVPNPV